MSVNSSRSAHRKKLLDAFGEGLLDRINPVTGRLHTSFLLAGARTGRLASAGPNIQQMPKSKSKDFRRIFVAPPGQLFLALDYNQIELRAAAEFVSDWCGQPSILQQAFADGLDAHTATAQRMTGKNRPEDVTPEERQAAKPCNFGLLYRMGDRGFFNYLQDQLRTRYHLRGSEPAARLVLCRVSRPRTLAG